VLQTADIRNRLLDPLGYFRGSVPEALIRLLALWATRLGPEMTVADIVFSYFGLLHDLQDGLDSRTGEPLLDPLAGRPPEAYRPFFLMFPNLLPTLLEERAPEALEVWRRALAEVFLENKGSPV